MSAGTEHGADGRVNRLTPMRFVMAFGVVSMLADLVYEGARSITGPYLATQATAALLFVPLVSRRTATRTS